MLASEQARNGALDTAKQIEAEVALKLGMLTDGVCVDDSATEGYGTRFKEQAKWLFEWDHVTEKQKLVAEEIELPAGTIVGIRENPTSQYKLTAQDGRLFVLQNGKPAMEASHIPRPAHYAKKTSDGINMGRILPVRGKDCLVYNYSTYCHFNDTGDQCHYCSAVHTHKTYQDDRMLARKNFEQLKEVYAEAVNEDRFRHLIFTGGYNPKHPQLVLMGLRAFKEALGLDYVPACINTTAPLDRAEIETLYEESGGSKGGGPIYNLEVWHPDYFRAICPGKEKFIGRDNWIQALKWAVEIFGKGKVSTFFVPGLEPMEYLLEGIEYCCSIGVQPMGITWAVSRGSKFWRHRTPTLDWHLELNEKTTDLWFEYDFVRPAIMDSGSNPNVCLDCNFTTVVANLIHKRKLEQDPNWVFPTRPTLKEEAGL